MGRKIIAICLSIFAIAFVVHIVDLNSEGRTWDEQFKTDTGIAALKNIVSRQFSYNDWAVGFEHPPVAKYLYGLSFLPELKTIDPKNITKDEYDYLLNENYYAGIHNGLIKVQPYDFTLPRLVSAALNSATVALVFLIGYLCFQQALPGIIGSIVLLSTPRFLAMGRLMTYESLSSFLTTLLFLVFLNKKDKLGKITSSIPSGILLGLLLWTRYNNISVFLTYIGWVVGEVFKKTKVWKNAFLHVFLSFLIAGSIGFILWPFLWIDFPRGIFATVLEHNSRTIVTSLFHVLSFFQTTPLLYLVLLAIGLWVYMTNKKLNQILIVWWFFSTALFFTMFSSPGGGTRYMFVIYPAFALIAAGGLHRLISNAKGMGKTLVLGCLMLYGISTLSSIHPYYLDYYNALIGGVKGAEERKLEVSWWGEGQKAAGMWLQKNAPQNAKVGLLVTPKYVFPRTRTDIGLLPYGEQIDKADYVVVSKNDLQTFKKTPGNWNKVHEVVVQNVSLVYIYKRGK